MKNIEAAAVVLARASGKGRLYFNDDLMDIVDDLDAEVAEVRRVLLEALKFVNEHEPPEGQLRYRWHDLRADLETLL